MMLNTDLSQEDLNLISAALDALVKRDGLQVAKPVAALILKLEQAVAAANKPPEND